jgi:hypothetical protein
VALSLKLHPVPHVTSMVVTIVFLVLARVVTSIACGLALASLS